MRVTTLLALLGAAVVTAAAANEEQQVRDAERTIGAAIVKADAAVLNAMLAAELAYTHSDATTDTKAQYLANLANGSMKYESIEQSDFSIRVYGKTAVSRSILAMKVNRNGRASSFRAQALRVWVKNGGKWQLVAHQTTRLAA